jgi:PAS domain-containing protein
LRATGEVGLTPIAEGHQQCIDWNLGQAFVCILACNPYAQPGTKLLGNPMCSATSSLEMGLFCGLMCSLTLGQASSAAVPSLHSLVDEIARAQTENRPQSSYQVVRKYRVFPSNNSSAASEIVAAVDFLPPTTKRYTIQKTSGNRRAEQVVKGILDHEVEASAQGRHIPTAAVMQDNYDVAYLGEDVLEGHPCFLLGLSPRRKDGNLIVGNAWVDKRTFLIRQINGDLVKTPSWWLKKVHVKMMFDYVGGTWLQTATEAVADVRVFGKQTLTSEIVEFRNNDIATKTHRFTVTARRVRDDSAQSGSTRGVYAPCALPGNLNVQQHFTTVVARLAFVRVVGQISSRRSSRVEGRQKFGCRTHVVHSFIEPEIVAVWINACSDSANANATKIPSPMEDRTAQTPTPDHQLFRDVFNASPIGIAVENLEGQPLFVNPAFCSMLGFSEEEMCTKHCIQFSPPEDAASHRRPLLWPLLERSNEI